MIRAAALLLLALGAPAQARIQQAAIASSEVELARGNGGSIFAAWRRGRVARPAPQNDITATLEAMKLARTAYPHVTRGGGRSDTLAQ